MREQINQPDGNKIFEENLTEVLTGRLEQKIVDNAYSTLSEYQNGISLHMQQHKNLPEEMKSKAIEAEKILGEMSKAITEMAKKFGIPKKQ